MSLKEKYFKHKNSCKGLSNIYSKIEQMLKNKETLKLWLFIDIIAINNRLQVIFDLIRLEKICMKIYWMNGE